MSRTDPAPEASMEEILASIRRIITEDPGEDRARPPSLRDMSAPPQPPARPVHSGKGIDFAGDIARALNDAPALPQIEEDDIFDMSGSMREAMRPHADAGPALPPMRAEPPRPAFNPAPALNTAPAFNRTPPQGGPPPRAATFERPNNGLPPPNNGLPPSNNGLPPMQPAPMPRAPAPPTAPARPQPPSFGDPFMPAGARPAQAARPLNGGSQPSGSYPVAPNGAAAARPNPAAAGPFTAPMQAQQRPTPSNPATAASPGPFEPARMQAPPAKAAPAAAMDDEIDDVLDLSPLTPPATATIPVNLERQPLSERLRVEVGDGRTLDADPEFDVLELGPPSAPSKPAPHPMAAMANGLAHPSRQDAMSEAPAAAPGAFLEPAKAAEPAKPEPLATPLDASTPVAPIAAAVMAPVSKQAVPVAAAADAARDQTAALVDAANGLAKSAAVTASALLVPGTSRTLEDTVAALLRPMLREWLDTNMPRIVEKALVKDEPASAAEGGEQV